MGRGGEEWQNSLVTGDGTWRTTTKGQFGRCGRLRGYWGNGGEGEAPHECQHIKGERGVDKEGMFRYIAEEEDQ